MTFLLPREGLEGSFPIVGFLACEKDCCEELAQQANFSIGVKVFGEYCLHDKYVILREVSLPTVGLCIFPCRSVAYR